jgi:hypothetical protein
MGYSERHRFPAVWPVPPSYYDPKIAMQSYEELGFDWVSLSEHHYSGNRTRSEDTVKYAAAHQLGLGVSYDRVEDVARVPKSSLVVGAKQLATLKILWSQLRWEAPGP